jgi:two-component system cell cycle sensor histidine kinase/response regulator CckA
MLAESSLHGLRALLVEDEALIAEELRTRLHRLGVQVVDIVDTGESAVAFARASLPQLILMDIRLKGGMDGIEAASRIRDCVPAPIIFLTAHSDQATLERAKQTGPLSYVLKPIRDREFEIAVELSVHRYRAERRLQLSQARHAATLASIGDCVIATDSMEMISFINPAAARLLGIDAHEAIGRRVSEVLPLIDEQSGRTIAHPLLVAQRQQRQTGLPRPTLLQRKNQEDVPIDDSVAPILDDKGQCLGAIMAFRDVRERRATERALQDTRDQLRHAQKMEALGTLAAGVAHDFNNMLTVIDGFASLAMLRRSDSESEDSVLAHLQGIQSTCERAAQLTRQLLTLGRGTCCELEEIEVAPFLEELAPVLAQALGQATHYEWAASQSLQPILWNRNELQHVLLNLALNARDALRHGGRFRISASSRFLVEEDLECHPGTEPGSFVLLQVEDDGCGMSDEVRRRAFEPFFTTRQREGGNGLGLAMVHQRIVQAGGFVTLESEEGRGTIFHLGLPTNRNPA